MKNVCLASLPLKRYKMEFDANKFFIDLVQPQSRIRPDNKECNALMNTMAGLKEVGSESEEVDFHIKIDEAQYNGVQ